MLIYRKSIVARCGLRYGKDGTGLIAQESDDEYLTYHFNNIGNTQLITNEIGEIVQTFDYGPYGELTNKVDCGIIFLYNGELGIVTDANGLYYMRARYYNPEIKSFINQDVLTGTITDSPSLNRYAYVNGNPISLNDPFGLSPLLNWLGGITGHDVLDVLGMLPGVGFVFDGINGAWYAAEGDYFNAACSFVSALPGVGDAVGIASKFSKIGCAIQKILHVMGDVGGIAVSSKIFEESIQNILDATANGETVSIADVLSAGFSGFGIVGHTSSLKNSLSTAYCFVAGTLVTTEDGFKPIEEIEVGDRVLSENELTGEVAVKTVTETYVNETEELVHIGVNGETISSTPSHPFYVNKFGWTLAGSLRAGDVLVLSNGELVTVEWVQHEILESPIKVYNFEVEDFHTYFVGENGIFVHNGCGDNSWNEYQKEHAGEGKSRSELAAEYNATKPVKATNNTGKVHANSLDYDGINYGYVLKDKTTGEVLKYGESINPSGRYTETYLNENNAVMTILTEGTKRDVHQWQIDFNNIYKQFTGEFPRLTVYGN